MLKKILIITTLFIRCTTSAYSKLTEQQANNILGRIEAEGKASKKTQQEYEKIRENEISEHCKDLEKQCTLLMQEFRDHVEGKKILRGIGTRKKGKFDFEEYEYSLTNEEAAQHTCRKLNDILKTINYMHHMSSEKLAFTPLIALIEKCKSEVSCPQF